nr:MAG: ORF1 [TTV-like mini virus]
MPWFNYYRRRQWRKRKPWFRRFRKTLRRRPYRRRYWVRRRFFKSKRKLKKLPLQEYQPKSIRQCKCKGFLCLFQCTENRFSYNFDMYEESYVPERLPGGGGFSLKNLSLNSLYVEHTMGHNFWTHSNKSYPLMRYKGCKIKFYQSEDIDYVCTYSNTWPLISNMQMYNSLQPSIHLQQKHKIIVPSKRTLKRRRPYITKFIQPPTQMQNKWYFQKSLANIPLFMLRTSCCSLDHYYIGNRQQSTNMTITTLNPAMIQNRQFGSATTYICRTIGTVNYFIYSTDAEIETIANIPLTQLIILTNTKDYKSGQTLEEAAHSTKKEDWINRYRDQTLIGNPFHTNYLTRNYKTFVSSISPSQIELYIETLAPQTDIKNLTLKSVSTTATGEWMDITIDTRYNPYKDNGVGNKAYFLSVGPGTGHGWDPPGSDQLENNNLPLWILLFGFPDFIKKSKVIHNVDTKYILVIKTTKIDTNISVLIPISNTFEYGTSPYLPINDNPHPDKTDLDRWYPQYQYQQEAINTICHTGPGTPKIPPGATTEAKIKYTFYFKWGGELPPMEEMQNPSDKPIYPVPNNLYKTTSLQNPETRPEMFLYHFDERRGQLTDTATKRMQKDWETKDTSFLSTEPRFGETTQAPDPQEEMSSEEEEEDLFQLLNKQRRKQLLLKQRILATLNKLQNLE